MYTKSAHIVGCIATALIADSRPCPTFRCDTLDFNRNGVTPEDQDVIDFFNVLAGGTCD